MQTLSKPFLGVPLFRWLLLAILGLILLVASWQLRNQLNIEWSLESLQNFVRSLGLWGPISYIGILVFRFLFLIPSSLLLLASGLLFGPWLGALYAGLGLTGSALSKLAFVALFGRDHVLAHLPARTKEWVARAADQARTAWGLAAVSAYPFLPKHVFHIAAAISGMPVRSYASAVTTGSFVRAATFAYFGSLVTTTRGLIVATAALFVLFALPWCFPQSRRWLLTPKHST